MDIISAFVLLILATIAVSYGWGMRGTTIGGEKGAMLPGALLGALLAQFSGILIVQEHFYIFSALGAVGMYFGGCMTYGETLSLSMSARPATKLKKGLTALFVKGFLWFAVFGSVFSTGINAICGKYDVIDLVLILVLTPTLALVGLKVFNRPLDTKNVIYPKIYFSKTRKEYWGAMAGMVIAFLIVNIINLNAYSVIFSLICGLFGGFGWVVAQLIQIYLKHYTKDSKIGFIRKLNTNACFDTWKAMECTLGAIGGAGCVIAFICTYDLFKSTVFVLELQGGLKSLNERLTSIFVIFWFVLLLLDMLHYFVKMPLTIAELKKLHSSGKISDKKFRKKMEKAMPDTNEFKNKFNKACEAYEFIVYAAIPFILVALGSSLASKTITIFILFWVLAQEIGYEKKKFRIPLTILGVLLLAVQLIFKNFVSVNVVLFIYTVIYEALTLLLLVHEILENTNDNSLTLSKKERTVSAFKNFLKCRGFVITHSYFIICIILVLVNI